MITELLDELDYINKDLVKLLEFEYNINLKKLKGQKLTHKEIIFDNYLIKPSTMIKYLQRREKKNDN